MPKKLGIGMILAGAVLLFLSLSLLQYNRQEDARAGQEADIHLASVKSKIEKEATEITAAPVVSSGTAPPFLPTLAPEMPVEEIDGYGYVGSLSIPSLGLTLPVMSDWDYVRLKIAPCRQFGSSRTDDLVIAGHNYDTHFGSLGRAEIGAQVIVTDMEGIRNTYKITAIEILPAWDVESVENSGHDLVLYTCTFGGNNRVALFCDRTEEDSLNNNK